MRAIRWIGVVVLCLIVGAPLGVADEKASSRETAVEKALDALRLRIQARVKEGELLAKAGRTDEALAAFRSVGPLYDRGLAEIRELLAATPARRAAPADTPFASPALAPRAPGVQTAAEAIERGLAWLAAHQAPTGAWQAAGFANWCKGKPILNAKLGPDGIGKAGNDVGVTGLAVLAFLENGHTMRGRHPYAKHVRQGLAYLLRRQDAEGCIGPRSTQHYIYNHAAAALALLEAFSLTRDDYLLDPCQKALNFLAMARNPYMAWRYGVRPGDNDTSVTSWCIKSLRVAELVNEADRREGRKPTFQVDKGCFEGALAWIDKMTDAASGRVGYHQRGGRPARPQEHVARFPAERSESMTAAGILTRIHCGQDPRTHPLVRKGAVLCANLPPVWNPTDGSIDMYYWYQGAVALYIIGGQGWDQWSRALDRAVIATQRRDGDVCSFLGSWDPIGPWGDRGGRVYSTALMVLTLTPKAAEDREAGVFRKRPKRK